MTLQSQVKQLMEAHGFHLVRRNKHMVWRDALGRQIVTALTPSDKRVLKNIESMIRRLKGRVVLEVV